MKHPCTALEGHPQWEVIKKALEDLAENQNLSLTIPSQDLICHFMAKLIPETPVVVDWAKCESAEAFYDLVLPQCGSPSWHGRNLNALRDSWITGGINAGGPPYSFCFFNGNQISAELTWLRDIVEEIARDSITENGGQIHKMEKALQMDLL